MIIIQEAESARRNGSGNGLVTFAKGVAIYREGDTNHYWFEVVSGIVRTCRFLADGHRQLTGFYYAGDVFGVEDEIHGETAEAVTDVFIRRHERAGDALGETDSAVSKSHRIALQRALQTARDSIFLFGHKTALARVAAFLIAMTERMQARSDVELPMSRSDIADHLGLTIHTVSRTISDLARQGLIALDGPKSLRIIDGARLRALAGDDIVRSGRRNPALAS